MSNRPFSFPAQAPFVEPGTGKLTREALRLWDAVFFRIGGTNAPTNNDLDNGLQFDIREADTAELAKRVRDLECNEPADNTAAIAELVKRVRDLETELTAYAGLAAQVAELRKALTDTQTESLFV